MGQTIRFGVSLDSDLLEKFDKLCEQRCYQTRSEAIRDLIRNTLVEEEWKDDTRIIAGTLTLVYDHHKSDLSQKLVEIQHDHHDVIITSLHVHLDHYNCLEVLLLKGDGDEVRTLAQKLVSTKGVKHGKLTLATTGQDLV
ncbi:nickel-responsive transcriptional regulator NikR [Desulfovibrio subterraneus]|jgi:CopG family nickel-responsive transcriptional regulator|uniref:nickel-responsive transcriptional regulator NikR n=1 Tax=Desulfovibrio subterraneus TaxID=2718620 RepID=UPI0022B8F490|nr:nickel-responsive transcriptional regulator NikR [Desulfovibrio subterraneus]WBF68797.1 nickel-responsive transcriptional regulator NikR [Desulfovibrio subterraneus]